MQITYKKALALAKRITELESDNPDWENCLVLAQTAIDELVQLMEKEIEDRENLG